MTTVTREFYQEIRTPSWDKHGGHKCHVKEQSRWSVAPISWADIHKLLGIAGIITPDATGGSLQFEEVPDDDIAGSSATSSSPAPEVTSRPIAHETAASSSTGEAAAKGKPLTYAEVISQQPASSPNRQGQI